MSTASVSKASVMDEVKAEVTLEVLSTVEVTVEAIVKLMAVESTVEVMGIFSSVEEGEMAARCIFTSSNCSPITL